MENCSCLFIIIYARSAAELRDGSNIICYCVYTNVTHTCVNNTRKQHKQP